MTCMHVSVAVTYVVLVRVHPEFLPNMTLLLFSLLPCDNSLLDIKEVFMKIGREVTLVSIHWWKSL